MTEPCACNTWAGDMRVGYPNGHHPKCSQQPHPSRTVELDFTPELLVDAVLLLPGAKILDARIDYSTGGVVHPNIRFLIDVPDAPADAVSMCPAYTMRRWPDGGRRDHYLSAISWVHADGSSSTQHFDPPADEKPAAVTE